jgi:flavin reductase (DIM6/NTAB) family NADH-FMN oxidoreductase RutF
VAQRVIERVDDHRASVVAADELRRAMGRFATGVAVVTSRDAAGDPVGTTANAVTSVSLDPPLVLVCLERASLTLRALREYGAFAVNVLAQTHRELSAVFARRGSNGAWAGVTHATCSTGCARLAGALTTIDCSVDRLYPGGDHEIVVGRVEEIHLGDGDAAPLVFHGGVYVAVETPPSSV